MKNFHPLFQQVYMFGMTTRISYPFRRKKIVIKIIITEYIYQDHPYTLLMHIEWLMNPYNRNLLINTNYEKSIIYKSLVHTFNNQNQLQNHLNSNTCCRIHLHVEIYLLNLHFSLLKLLCSDANMNLAI